MSIFPPKCLYCAFYPSSPPSGPGLTRRVCAGAAVVLLPAPARTERERESYLPADLTPTVIQPPSPPAPRMSHSLCFYQTQTAMDRILKSVTLLKSSEDSAAIYLLIIDF